MYFVDKTEMLRELVPLVELKDGGPGKSAAEGGKSPKYVCITRPCRFGKTVMANMIVSIMLDEMPKKYGSYDSYMERIENLLMDDLMMTYPEIKVRDSDAVWDVLKKIFEYCGGKNAAGDKSRGYENHVGNFGTCTQYGKPFTALQ